MEKKIKKAIEDFNMLACSSIVAGFSGGSDSCAMLHVLHSLCKSKGISLFAIHVNHLIRGDEAGRDMDFCISFCRQRDIPLTVITKDIPALAKEQGKGLEECARDFRYSCFNDFCRQKGVERIATAHNANDNCETVLFNLARGSGIKGLCGIPPVRDNIIRPLIYCEKQEIVEYCRQNNIEYMKDSTNDSLEYTRNYIRHTITPALLRINGDAIGAISRGSMLLRKDMLALEEIGAGYIDTPREELVKLPDPIITRVLLQRYKNSGFDPTALEEKHISSLLDLIKRGKRGDSVSLPQKTRGVMKKNDLVFCQNTPPPEKVNSTFKLCEGVNIIPSLNCRIDIYREGDYFKKNQNVYKIAMKAEVFFDTIDPLSTLYCRARQDGDSYRMDGMTRKVKKLLWQLDLSLEEKKNYPVICDQKGVALLPPFSPREDLLNKNGEKYIIDIYIFKMDQ